MALAETAQLIVNLKLNDQLSGCIARAKGQLGGLNQMASGSGMAIGRTAGAFGVAGTAAGKFGGALGHAGSQLRNLAFGPLGLIGITGGLLTFGGAISAGISKAQDMGAEVRRLTALTGESAQSMSTLAAGLEHFGVGADRATRSIGFLE